MNNDDFPQIPPRLCDQAAVEILDFLHYFIQAFETAYGDQIRRHYQNLASNRLSHPPYTAATERQDPPF